jgi:tryptophanyl-tRNA synthetase
LNRERYNKELSKYPKEVIIKVLTNNCLFNSERLLHDVKWESVQLKFDTLRSQEREIRKEMNALINKKDSKSFVKYIQLMDESTKIDKKIASVMKRMDNLLGIRSE